MRLHSKPKKRAFADCLFVLSLLGPCKVVLVGLDKLFPRCWMVVPLLVLLHSVYNKLAFASYLGNHVQGTPNSACVPNMAPKSSAPGKPSLR